MVWTHPEAISQDVSILAEPSRRVSILCPKWGNLHQLCDRHMMNGQNDTHKIQWVIV
jgi:hypothetical protein